MNYGDAVNAALRLLDEYSSRGVTLVAIKTADLRIKMPDAVNQILMDLAVTTGKLNKEWTILNFPVCNEVARDTSIIKGHIPGTDDIIATQVGSRSYYLEVSGYYHVVIEEQINGVWATLVELQPVSGSEPTIFTELKGLLTPSSLTNAVRMRLTGDYPYPYHNHILYPYTFPSDEEVQQNRPWFEVALPSDWLKLKEVKVRGKSQRQWDTFYEYRETPTHFYYNRYATGEILVNYYRKPTLVTVADPANPTAEELAQVLDAVPDAAQVIPYGVAGTVVAGFDTSISSYFLQLYENRKFSLIQNDGSYGIESVTSVTGW
jgi:hypothetical protein